jgi:hypothetical protein
MLTYTDAYKRLRSQAIDLLHEAGHRTRDTHFKVEEQLQFCQAALARHFPEKKEDGRVMLASLNESDWRALVDRLSGKPVRKSLVLRRKKPPMILRRKKSHASL